MLRYGIVSSVVMLKKKRLTSTSTSTSVVGVVNQNGNGETIGRRWCRLPATAAAAGVVAAAMMLSTAWAIEAGPPETLSNIPQTLSGECPSAEDCKKARIQRPKSRKAESCTIKCVTTCIRGGGDGSPGEGPFNIRRYLLIF